MNVQSTPALASFATEVRSPSTRHSVAASSANTVDTLHVSQAAREALATSVSFSATSGDASVEAKLAAIKAKDALSRTQEEQEYVRANDKRLAEITAQGRPPEKLTADDVDYMQKAAGFVNTFANLSTAEKALYDKAVASGNTEAAAAISKIAMTRMSPTAGGANGTSYDPINTEITAANIEKFFRHSFVDPTGKTQAQFQTLIQFLQDNSTV